MEDKLQQQLEVSTFTWMLETFDPKNQGASRRCKYCRYLSLGVGLICSVLVFISYRFEVFDTVLMIIFSAVGGASFMAFRLINQSAMSMHIVSKYVDLRSARERLSEIKK
jgi:hypothetical protein